MKPKTSLGFEEYINCMEETAIKANSEITKITFEHKYNEVNFEVKVIVKRLK